jgi:hypothetical protein
VRGGGEGVLVGMRCCVCDGDAALMGGGGGDCPRLSASLTSRANRGTW